MEGIIKAFYALSADSKAGPYSYYENSLLRDLALNRVPTQCVEAERKSALEYGDRGFKHFHPWFLADQNPSSIDEYFQVVMDVLKHVDPILNKEEYWFFRADVNIIMMWYRVSFSNCFDDLTFLV